MSLRFENEEEFNNWRRAKAAGKEPPTEDKAPGRGKRRAPEEEAQIEVFKVLYWNEKRFPFLKWIHGSMNGATASSNAQAGKRRACGQKSGVSDICIPYARRGFNSGWIELKIAPNKLSPAQVEFVQAMGEAGNWATTAWSAEQVFEAIEWYFDIKLAR